VVVTLESDDHSDLFLILVVSEAADVVKDASGEESEVKMLMKVFGVNKTSLRNVAGIWRSFEKK
jgi:hypothetical protein